MKLAFSTSIVIALSSLFSIFAFDSKEIDSNIKNVDSLNTLIKNSHFSPMSDTLRQDSLLRLYKTLIEKNRKVLFGISKPVDHLSGIMAESLRVKIDKLSQMVEWDIYDSLTLYNKIRALLYSPFLGEETIQKFNLFNDSLIVSELFPAIISETLDFGRACLLTRILNERVCELPEKQKQDIFKKYFKALNDSTLRPIVKMEIVNGVCRCPEKDTPIKMSKLYDESKKRAEKSKVKQDIYFLDLVERCFNKLKK